jgi:hypothetical protein
MINIMNNQKNSDTKIVIIEKQIEIVKSANMLDKYCKYIVIGIILVILIALIFILQNKK